MRKEDFVSLGVSEDAAEKASAAFEKAVNAIKLSAAVDLAVSRSGARNVKAVKALLDLDKASLNDDGTVAGLDAQLDALKLAPDSEFLFDSGERGGVELIGAVTGETGREAPDNKVDFSKLSYSELCAFMDKNPRARI